MNNHLLIKEFSSKLRPNIDSLMLEINKSPLDTTECIERVKNIKNDITHLNNLLKIEVVLQNPK